MFSFFKKKTQEIKVIDKITIDQEAKFTAMDAVWQSNKELVILFWFDDSLQSAGDYFSRHNTASPILMMCREASAHQLSGKKIIFGEHYPIASREKAVFETLGLQTVEIYSSLKEPLFSRFGGDRIIGLMQSLGMEKNEVIEHTMISNSIRQAQQKIEKKVTYEQSTRSAGDWFKINLGE